MELIYTDPIGKELGYILNANVVRNVTLDTAAPVIKSISITPNPVDCGKTFIISVEITD